MYATALRNYKNELGASDVQPEPEVEPELTPEQILQETLIEQYGVEGIPAPNREDFANDNEYNYAVQVHSIANPPQKDSSSSLLEEPTALIPPQDINVNTSTDTSVDDTSTDTGEVSSGPPQLTVDMITADTPVDQIKALQTFYSANSNTSGLNDIDDKLTDLGIYNSFYNNGLSHNIQSNPQDIAGGTWTWLIPNDAPNVLWYRSKLHDSMVGKINIMNAEEGFKGETGSIGFPGDTGPVGFTGPIGFTGPAGQFKARDPKILLPQTNVCINLVIINIG